MRTSTMLRLRDLSEQDQYDAKLRDARKSVYLHFFWPIVIGGGVLIWWIATHQPENGGWPVVKTDNIVCGAEG